jgi:transposase-like protein
MARRNVELHSLGQASKMLAARGVSLKYRTLRQMVAEGRIHAHHMPHRTQQAGQWLLDDATIDALAATYRRRP